MTTRIHCAGAIVLDPGGRRLLLIQRGEEPGRGLWSVPGGRLETGETAQQATAREVREETGLEVEVGPLLGRVDRPGPGRSAPGRPGPGHPGPEHVVYQIDDFTCVVTGGRLTAGDDATDARWVPVEQVATLPLVAGLLDLLHEWGVLDAPS